MTKPKDMVEVTPDDREAAAHVLGYANWQCLMHPGPRDSSGVTFVKPGLKWSAERAAEIIARHRLTAQAQGGDVEKRKPVAFAPKGHLSRYLKGKNSGCWIYGTPTADDDTPLYAHPTPTELPGDALREATILLSTMREIAAADPGPASSQSLAHEMAAMARQALTTKEDVSHD